MTSYSMGHTSPSTPLIQAEGYKAPWFLVTSALALSAAQVVEVFTARLWQEDAIRDHKQRVGMEECRAWTKEQILRTFQVQPVALTLLRLLQACFDHAWGSGSWWLEPEWNRRKRHASIWTYCKEYCAYATTSWTKSN